MMPSQPPLIPDIHRPSESTRYFSDWSDLEFSRWLAGFIDGEGCFYLPKSKAGAELHIGNTNRDVIESIQVRSGVGYIEITEFENEKWKTKYCWRVRRYEEIRDVILQVRWFLTIKADAADRVMARLMPYFERRRLTTERHEEVFRLSKLRRPPKEIARRVGLTQSAVTQIIAAMKARKARGRKAQRAPIFARSIYRSRSKKQTLHSPNRTRRLSPKETG